MQVNDLINGTFEAVGAIMCWANVYKLYKDKAVRGVLVGVQVFFSLWGFWNLYYYPSLGQWASFAGGVVLVSGNAAWCVLAYRYSKKEEPFINITEPEEPWLPDGAHFH